MPIDKNQFILTEPDGDRNHTEREMAVWKDMVRRMPEVRVEKIQHVRAALRAHQYDERHYFDLAIDILARSLSVE